jgi:hypothetical protein
VVCLRRVSLKETSEPRTRYRCPWSTSSATGPSGGQDPQRQDPQRLYRSYVPIAMPNPGMGKALFGREDLHTHALSSHVPRANTNARLREALFGQVSPKRATAPQADRDRCIEAVLPSTGAGHFEGSTSSAGPAGPQGPTTPGPLLVTRTAPTLRERSRTHPWAKP